MPRLLETATPLRIAPNVTIVAPGIKGDVRAVGGGQAGFRSASDPDEQHLEAAAAAADVRIENVFELTLDPQSQRMAALKAAPTRAGRATMQLRAAARSGVHQFVLLTDEAGASRWILPNHPGKASSPTRGGAGELVFDLPVERPDHPAKRETFGTRGLGAKIAGKVVRLLAWRIEPLVGAAVRGLSRLETRWHPYRFLRLEKGPKPKSFEPLPREGWGSGRHLLFLHGTFSSTRGAFGGLPGSFLEKARRAYGGRVVAYDHPTLCDTVAENVQRFVEDLPEDARVEFDVIAHSRGGLVARRLAEGADALDWEGRKVRIRNVALVGVPNRGTALADPDRGLEILDRYTNVLNKLPDAVYPPALEGVLTGVKLLAYTTIKNLPGIADMRPSERARSDPGFSGAARYHAVAADWEPTPTDSWASSLGNWAKDRFVDSCHDADNDIVVPTEGCYASGPATASVEIPKGRRMVFEAGAGIHHSAFFGSKEVQKRLESWILPD